MNENHKTKISKFLSLILRHSPEKIGLVLETGGWIKVSDLLQASATHGNNYSLEELREVVETNDKNRFSFSENGEKIRANQGHSLQVKIDFEKKTPPEVLYHGTAERNIEAILRQGLKKMQRHHVHLSEDSETARKVGIRYGKPIILRVNTVEMINNGFEFFISTNGVWLTEEIPPEFLEIF